MLYSSADFGMDDREMMRDDATFEEDIMHGATASNLLLEAEPGPANLPDKSNHMEYDDFGDASMGNSDGGMRGEQHFIHFFYLPVDYCSHRCKLLCDARMLSIKSNLFIPQLTHC